MSCTTCTLVERRDQQLAEPWDNIIRTDNFDVVHAYNSTLLGWIVLVARRHISSLAELTEDEAVEMGQLVRKTSMALEAITGCNKTYVMQFAEAEGHNHVHIHLVPRADDMPVDLRGKNVFGYLGADENQRVPTDDMNAFATEFRKHFA